MEEKILDPTEILIDRDGTIRTDTIRANPWLRFLGRMADYGIIGLIFYALQKFFSFQLDIETLIPIQFAAWIPIEALLLSFWGATPGKWLVGTKIERGGFLKLELRSSFRRAFSVWFRGIGMGIIVINFLCMLTAYYRLQAFKTTTWDLDEQITVTHKPVATWRLALSFLLVLSSLFFK